MFERLLQSVLRSRRHKSSIILFTRLFQPNITSIPILPMERSHLPTAFSWVYACMILFTDHITKVVIVLDHFEELQRFLLVRAFITRNV